jgi:hypothetical protein
MSGTASAVPADDRSPADGAVSDPRSLRGVAHPLRVRLLGLLRAYGPSTATRLAHLVGESSGATSYHLRQLAMYGFITEEPGRGAGRERWWRAVHRQTVLRPLPEGHNYAEVEGYLRAVAASYTDRIASWIGGLTTMPPEWANVGVLSDWHVRLSPQQARQLAEELRQLVERYQELSTHAVVESVSVQVQVLPCPDPRLSGEGGR